MKFVIQNIEDHPDLRVGINSGLPISPETLVKHFGGWANGEATAEVPPGVYYIYVAAGSPDKYPAGTTIAQTGGAHQDATVILTKDDLIVVGGG